MNKEIPIEETAEAMPPKRKFPLFAKIFLGIGAFSALLYIAFLLSEDFADFFNRYISSVFRAVMAYATSWIPFSLGEFLLILTPVIFAAIVIYGTKKYADTWRDVFIYCGSLVSVITLIFAAFTIGFAPAYRGATLDKKLGLDRQKVSAEELYATALILSEKVNEESEKITYNTKTDFSVMPYGIDGMNDRLIDAYDVACDKYTFVQRLDSKLKPVMLSELMSYTHITGVYSFFTGEANINVAFPDYTIPYTAAHELSHQRGIAREDEANFMAFLVCIDSEDAYIRYSGYLNLFEYVSSALYSASPELYYAAVDTLNADVRREMRAYSAFFDKYRDSTASKVSETVNNTSLILQGTEGTKSYGMVVDLAVAYYK
ncbi:MAG: DUF3810 domain-containing protein [Clostridia bacterium]|nr:DUF3810 domain-containing protein [Clostridia bacterium]